MKRPALYPLSYAKPTPEHVLYAVERQVRATLALNPSPPSCEDEAHAIILDARSSARHRLKWIREDSIPDELYPHLHLFVRDTAADMVSWIVAKRYLASLDNPESAVPPKPADRAPLSTTTPLAGGGEDSREAA